jgi:hypothetical protein
MAAVRPAGPEPMITTCFNSGVLMCAYLSIRSSTLIIKHRLIAIVKKNARGIEKGPV